MEIKHWMTCPAPICNDDQNPNFRKEVVWRGGEIICNRKPYTRFQRKQKNINYWIQRGRMRHFDQPYTAEELEGHSL